MYQTGHEKLYISEEIQGPSNVSQAVVSSPVIVAASSTTPSAVTAASTPSGGHSEAIATPMPTSKSIDWKLVTGSIPMMKQASGGYGFYVSGSPSGKNSHCGCESGLRLLFCVNFASVQKKIRQCSEVLYINIMPIFFYYSGRQSDLYATMKSGYSGVSVADKVTGKNHRNKVSFA